MSRMGGVLRLELKKTFLSRRGWWIYLLALAPVFLTLMHWLVEMRFHGARHSLGEDSVIFAALYHFYFLRCGIFFGCMGILGLGYRNTPLRRETNQNVRTLHIYDLLRPAKSPCKIYAPHAQ